MGAGGKMTWAFTLGLAMANAGSRPVVTMMVYDYAGVPARVMANAKAFAARSYGAAGVELRWVECPTLQNNSDSFRRCEEARMDHALSLKIITEPMALAMGSNGFTEDTLGIALVSSAWVKYERVQEIARVWAVPVYLVLGRTIAHEVGHLLPGESSNSTIGLMQRNFAVKDLTLNSGQSSLNPSRPHDCGSCFRPEPMHEPCVSMGFARER
jgi:hypothetical protein